MGNAYYESGGIAIARAIREEYIKNPNLCQACKAPILPKDGRKLADAKKKKFCSQKCNASFVSEARNIQRKIFPNNRKDKRTFVACASCGKDSNRAGVSNKRMFCQDCWQDKRKAILAIKKSESTHSKIRSHARKVAQVSCTSKCKCCGYDLYVEVCHIKAVKDFSDDALMGEINHPDNLVILCRNHHWEFDHGILKIDGTR